MKTMKKENWRKENWIATARYEARALRQELRRVRGNVSAWKQFWRSYQAYCRMGPAAPPEMRTLLPCLYDNTATTVIEPTYFYQDAWAFEKIVEANPARHIDIGSHHKFVALLSKVVPVTMVDIRPLSLPLASLNFQAGSILEMPYPDGACESISSMCVIEHIGLGRYGDPLDLHGTEKALAELKRITAPGGNLYLSVPVDDINRTYFNAHRAFSEPYLLEIFAPFEVRERRYIYEKFSETLGTGFGTGCYHLRRPLR